MYSQIDQNVTVAIGNHIQLEILDVDLEDAYFDDCGQNYLQVFAGYKKGNEPDMQKFCGFHKDDVEGIDCEPEKLPAETFCRPLPDPIFSHKNQMGLMLKTDASAYKGKGFQVKVGLAIESARMQQSGRIHDSFNILG